MILLALALIQTTPPPSRADALGDCVRARAERYAPTGEPAETIATATMSACRKEMEAYASEVAYDAAGAQRPSDALLQQTMTRLRREVREQVIRLVLDQRSQ